MPITQSVRARRCARTLDRAAGHGLALKAGFEYEFFVFDETPHSVREKHYRDLRPLTPGNFGYSVLRASSNADLFRGLMNYCDEIDTPLEGLHCETGPGVWEGALAASNGLAPADRAALFKTFSKVFFAKREAIATFMAKWSMDYPGQSGHFHFSLLDDAGDNAFGASESLQPGSARGVPLAGTDPADATGLPAPLRHAVGGLVRYVPELLTMLAPTVNSYTRLVKGAWAPTAATWGFDNRTTAFRVITGAASAQRIECRVSGADANPYLAAAAAPRRRRTRDRAGHRTARPGRRERLRRGGRPSGAPALPLDAARSERAIRGIGGRPRAVRRRLRRALRHEPGLGDAGGRTHGHGLAARPVLRNHMTRIGILQADSVREEFQDAFGSYPGMFRSLLSQAAADASLPVDFAVFDVEHGEYPAEIDACDAYVITGSRESVYADLPWIATLSNYVRSLHAARKKTVGVCFGHQLVAQALGGQTRPADVGWGVGVHRMRILAEERWMQPPLPAVSLLSSHKDQVVKMPPGARLLGSNDFCPIGPSPWAITFSPSRGIPSSRRATHAP